MVVSITIYGLDGASRASLSVDPSLTLKQIIKEACLKLNIPLDHINTLGLCYHRKPFADLSIPLRLTSIPPGAKLDLVKLATSQMQVGSVSVALQSGTLRKIEVVPATFSIWQILCHFEKKYSDLFTLVVDDAKNGRLLLPVVIVLNQEFGELEQLLDATLLSLGIANGTCLLRMIHRPTMKTMEQITNLLAAKLVGSEAKPEAPTNSDGSASASLTTPLPTPPDAEEKSSLLDRKVPSLASNVDIEPPLLESLPEQERRPVKIVLPMQTTSQIEELPDSFFELTEAEFGYFCRVASSEAKRLHNMPLMSRNKREHQHKEAILSRHPTTRIRFRFPDQVCIESAFHTTESIAELHAFLSLTLSSIPYPYTLSIGPPLQRLEPPKQQLWEFHLYPAAIINVTWEHPHPATIPTLDLLSSTQYTKEQSDPQSVANRDHNAHDSTSIAADAPSASAKKNQTPTAGNLPKWLRLCMHPFSVGYQLVLY